jgi:hypothetical protein
MYKRPALRNGTKIAQPAPVSEPVSPWPAKLENLIKTGKLVRIGTDDQNRAIYRLKDEGA